MSWQFGTYSTDLERDSVQYWAIADNVPLSITGDITISLWVKLESAPTSGNAYYLVTKRTDQGNQRTFAFFYYNNGGVPEFDFYVSNDGAANETLAKAQTLTVGVWYHIAVKWAAATSTATFYVNGASIGTATGAKTAMFDGTSAFAIGAAFDDSGNPYASFDGLINDVRVWARVLTPTEIGSVYTDPDIFDNGANLQAWWKFDNSALDETANDNDLTGYNTPTYVTDIPRHQTRLAVEIAGTPVDTCTSSSFTWTISPSEVSGTPVEANKMGWGWRNEDKHTSTWENQDKS